MAKKLLTLLFAGLSVCSLVQTTPRTVMFNMGGGVLAKAKNVIHGTGDNTFISDCATATVDNSARIAGMAQKAALTNEKTFWSLASAKEKANALSAGYFSTIFGVPAAATAWMFGSEAAKDGGRINMLQEALSESTKPAAVVEQVKELTRIEKLTNALTSAVSKVAEGVSYASTVVKGNPKTTVAVAATALAGAAAMALKGKVASKVARLSVEELVNGSNSNMELVRQLKRNGYRASDLKDIYLSKFSKDYILSQLPA